MTTQPFGGGGVDTITGGVNNYVMTAFDADTIQGEENLQFDGSTLTVTGAVVVGSDGSGHDVTFHSDTGSDNFLWDSSAEKLTITGTNAATALDVADGNVSITDDLDVDGTTNLDAVDIDGNVQLDGTFTVGVDGTGKDVKFFGDTSGDYMLWDSSDDQLELVRTGGHISIYTIRDENTSAGDQNLSIKSYHDESGSAKFAGSFNIDTSANNTGHGRLRFRVGNDDAGNHNAMIIEDDGGITIGGGIAHDSRIVFDGASDDFYIGLEHAANDLVIGVGDALGTTSAIEIDNGARIGLGIAPRGRQYLRIAPTFTSDGSSTVASLTEIAGTLTGASGDTGDLSGVIISPTTVTQTETETITNIQSLRVDEPKITDNLTGDITTASTVRIVSAPSEGESNYALFVAAGTSRFDGTVLVGQYGAGNDLIAYGSAAGTYTFWDASAATLFINETANAGMTTGLTINQGAADDEIFSLKSSDIAHGLLTYGGTTTETDTYFSISKLSATLGGVELNAIAEDAATDSVFRLWASGGDPSTTHSNSQYGLAHFIVMQHDGSDGRENMTANANVFSVHARTNDAFQTKFLVDAEGDLFADGSATTVMDSFDDAQLVRALDITRGFDKDIIRSKWDDFLQYGEDKLVELGILGETMENGGLLNVTALQRLHNGAIWQGYTRQMELQEEVTELKSRLLALEGA